MAMVEPACVLKHNRGPTSSLKHNSNC